MFFRRTRFLMCGVSAHPTFYRFSLAPVALLQIVTSGMSAASLGHGHGSKLEVGYASIAADVLGEHHPLEWFSCEIDFGEEPVPLSPERKKSVDFGSVDLEGRRPVFVDANHILIGESTSEFVLKERGAFSDLGRTNGSQRLDFTFESFENFPLPKGIFPRGVIGHAGDALVEVFPSFCPAFFGFSFGFVFLNLGVDGLKKGISGIVSTGPQRSA